MLRFLPAAALFAALASPAFVLAQDTPALVTPKEKAGYVVGRNIGENLMGQGLSVLDVRALALGIQDVFDGAETRVDEAEVPALFNELQTLIAAEVEERSKAKIEEGLAFLESNGARDGIVTTASGVQYQISTQGEGDSPTIGNSVTVHYTGRLLDGTVFDSSVARGTPASFPVSGVIRGWTEVLQLMKPGATWEVWIPSELAYGATGAGQDIGPNEVLNFTIELISVDG